jgi:2-keto-4-pentenoate hydratase/2-oxohepta-3-ene-1,7-dioic acid hydratase in catechol pathway
VHDRGEVDGVRLVTFQAGGNVGVGVRRDGVLLDTGYTSMLDLIRDGERGLERAEAASQEVSADRMLAPIPRPPKILCSGVNYASHAEENPDAVMPTEPFFFSKLSSAVIGPGEPIVIPTRETKTDYEVELAMVIGRQAKRLSEGSALEHVFGWTILHDVSARDVQFKDNQLTLGKGPDTFSPLGPEIVTADELGDWSTLRVSTTVNGETMQDSATSEMLFSPGRLLEFATGLVTLEPGDVVTTGSPAGVGCFRDPPVYLKPGDEVTVSVDRIGGLTNPVVAGW